MNEEDRTIINIIKYAVLTLVAMIMLGMWGCPHYSVWQQGLAGEAEFKRAEQNRRIAVQEASAKQESAKLLADADVARAVGVAEANKIIGDSLRNNEGYLRYLWISNMAEAKKEVIYIPTEAGIPILEAGKRE